MDEVIVSAAAGAAPPAPPATPTPLLPRLSPWRQGLAAARANAIPAVALTAAGVALLAGYYFHAPTHRAMERVADVKRQWGLLFSLVSTAIFAGLLPVLLQQIVPNLPHRAALRHLPFFLLLWGYRGVETDLFYRLQAHLFGDVAEARVVIIKLVLDLGFYTPVWCTPMVVVAYLWKDCGFSLAEARRRLGRRWYVARVVPVLIANNAIWLPGVAILYSLPLALQMPFQNLVQCLNTLIITLVMAAHSQADDDRFADERRATDEPTSS